MPPCESCQARLLDYLYDLLDADERSSVQTHLVDCVLCKTALDQATRQRGLLATAARLEFPEVSFHAPLPQTAPVVPAAQLRARSVPASQRERGRGKPQPVRHWGRYAAAAAVVLALSGVVLSGQRLSASHSSARREADAGTARVAEARTALEQAASEVEATCQIHNALVADCRAAVTWHCVPPEAAKTPHEYVTLLATDRPVYRSGLDTIHYRALVLDRYTLKPAKDDLRLVFELTGLDEAGAARTQNFPIGVGSTNALSRRALKTDVKGAAPTATQGIGAGDYRLDADVPDGQYLLTVREANGQFPAQQQSVYVRKPTVPLLANVEYERKAYQPGDRVTAYAHPVAPDQQALPNQNVRVLVNVDGRNYGADGKEAREGAKAKTDNFGNLKLDFKLPERIEKDQARLLVELEDATPLVSAIPLQLNRVQITFFPEGGSLVNGRANRVYFHCQTPAGAPTALRGRLLANGRPTEVLVATAADTPGTGVFNITPQAGTAYGVGVDASAASRVLAPLPKAVDTVALHVDNAVAGPGQPVRIHLLRPENAQPVVLALSCRGHLLDSQLLAPGQTEGLLQTGDGVDGVLEVTAYEAFRKQLLDQGMKGSGAAESAAAEQSKLTPVARRLVYRRPTDRLDVTLRPEQKGEQTMLSLATDDAKGQPVPSLALVAVTYRSATAAGPTASPPPTAPLLTELPRAEAAAEPDVLLAPGTASDDALDRVLGARPGPSVAEAAGNDSVLKVLDQAFERTHRDAEAKRQSSEKAAAELAASRERLAQAREAFDESRDNPAYHAALARLVEDGRLFEEFRFLAAPVLTALLVMALLASVVSAFRRSRLFPWFLAGAACAGLWLALLFTASQSPTHVAAAEEPRLALVTAQEPPAPQWPLPLADAAGKNAEEFQKEAFAATMKREKRDESDRKKMQAAGRADGANGANGSKSVGLPQDKDSAQNTADWPKLMEQQDLLPPPTAPRSQMRAAIHPQNAAGPPAAPTAVSPAPLQPMGGAGGATWANRMQQQGEALALGFRDNQKPGAAMEAKGSGFGGMSALPPMPLRPFAYDRSAKAAQPVLPAQTLYWHPALVLPDGRVQLAIDPGEPGLTYQVTVFAHTPDGRLGAQTVVLPPRAEVPTK